MIKQNLQTINQRIRSAERQFNRVPGSVQLLAVSKTKPVADCQAAIETGQLALGENYLQDALPKITTLAGSGAEWHFIGAIQSNKTHEIATHFNWVHTVCRGKILARLAAQRPVDLPPLNICLQLNLGDETQKAGCQKEDLAPLCQLSEKYDNINLRGLMAIPPKSTSFEQACQHYQQVQSAYDELKCQGFKLDTLSIGMSGDLEAAIACGATWVRIGTAIFGARA